jgi:hypothetical protein
MSPSPRWKKRFVLPPPMFRATAAYQSSRYDMTTATEPTPTKASSPGGLEEETIEAVAETDCTTRRRVESRDTSSIKNVTLLIT